MLTTLEFGMASRVVSAILFAVMFNITALAGGLYAIETGSHPSAAPATSGAMSDMAGMDMAQSTSSPHENGVPNDDDCNLPWSPGCGFRALCAPVAMTVGPLILAGVPCRHHPPVEDVDQVPASADRSPDHPPPRVLK